MGKDHRTKWRSALIVLLSTMPLPLLFSVTPLAATIATIILILWIVARHDNQSGSCLVLAVLTIIVLLILALLIAAFAYVHVAASG
jgi:formate-dependent nitrite reductase membrane component NrfD